VHSDERQASSPGSSPDEIRRHVVEIAAGRLRDADDSGSGATWPASARDATLPADPSGRAAVDLYLALLQDRLPVYVRTMGDLGARAGQRSVEDNLLPVARATIDFYCEILSVKVSAFTSPAQLIRLRQLMRARGLGPNVPQEMVASYLRAEQSHGRVAADVRPLATARLLLGGCVSYAFNSMLTGEDDQTSREEYIADIVLGLRLSSEHSM
jgi:hypothetical protein